MNDRLIEQNDKELLQKQKILLFDLIQILMNCDRK